MPSKRKKNEARKAKSKSQDCCVTFKPKNYVEILLSAHARTSQADILHLDQKAAKRTTCKQVCGKFQLFIARQWPENHSNSFKTRFSAKSLGANGLSFLIWIQISHLGCFIYTNHPGGNLVHKHKTIKFDIVRKWSATKYIQISWTD